MPEPLLFDLDGTLVDSLPDIAASANFVRRRYDLPEAPLDAIRAMVGNGMFVLLRKALEHRAETVFDEAVEVYREHHEEQCTRLVRPYPRVPEGLAHWRAAGHALAVVTNKPEEFARRILDHLGLSEIVPVLVAGDSCAERKPDPLPVWTALDRLGCDRDRGLMVGDSLNDVRAGQRAGIRTCAVTYGYGDADGLRAAGADEYWSEFGGAQGDRWFSARE